MKHYSSAERLGPINLVLQNMFIEKKYSKLN